MEMETMGPREVLDIWERGLGQHAVDRALTLLGAVHRTPVRRELAEWSLGHRDAALLSLYQSNFGNLIQAMGSCPDCEATVEVQLRVSDLLEERRRAPGGLGEIGEGGEVATPGAQREVMVGERAIPFRLPNSLDMAALVSMPDSEAARAELLRRLVGWEPGELSEAETRALEDAVELADPLTEISLGLSCPECGRGWDESLDVTAFVWKRVAASAERLLWQVDRLAHAYGWTEDDVLALSPARRQWYLEAVS